MRTGDVAKAGYRPSVTDVSRMMALVLVLAGGAILESVKLSSLQYPEIWGHLRAGSWILENGSWPRTGLFSQASQAAWRDFSWGYDVVAAGVYRLLGLRAIPVLLMIFRMAVAVVAFLLAGGRRGHFWGAVVVSLAAQIALGEMGPVAAFTSVIFLGVELLILKECRSSGSLRLLYALPVLFAVWANLDIGFVYGIGLTVLFLGVLSLERVGRAAGWKWLEERPRAIPLEKAALVCAGSIAASLVNPYGYQAYAAFWAIQGSAANRVLPGHRAMSFHQPQDYVVLLLTMGAFLALGMQRSRDLFSLGMLITGAALSFPSQRASWLVTIIAIAVIGSEVARGSESAAETRAVWPERGSVWAAGLALAVILVAMACGPSRQGDALRRKVAEKFPVGACDFVRNRQLPQPLFNSYAWGSFLTWYLPEYPVAIDGRRGLYSEEIETDYFKVMNAEIPYQEFAPMRQARTLLLDKVSPMREALRELPGFRVAYEDNLSIVLVVEEKQ